MYEIIKNVIERKEYELTAMLSKIDKLWVEGRITETQRDELSRLARGGAKLNNSVDVYAKLNELETRLRKLENEEGATDGELADEILEYTVGKWYYSGDKCRFEGANYICTAPDGVACVWSPKDYPTYWEVLTNA